MTDMNTNARPEITGRKIGPTSGPPSESGQPAPLDKRCREAHPEVIVVGDITYERNDVTAKKYGESERSVNRRKGAPQAFFGGVKYRPQPLYDNHVARTSIKQDMPAEPKRRKGGRGNKQT